MNLKKNKKEFGLFLKVARKINEKFKIKPIIWGSLGLMLVIGEFKKVKDIDFLVPDIYMKKRWNELRELMGNLEFKLVDEKEHEFEKSKIKVAFAGYSDLFVKIPVNLFKIYYVNGAEFRNLSAEQYLEQYKKILKIPYRKKINKVKQDREKIKRIESFIKNKKK
ncbi:hypothetical protein HZA33_00875 [Candidatus Pacearchaeota archaeon]|nr:hypothetical protein [Candidatus Pacearchaeota archaeon]